LYKLIAIQLYIKGKDDFLKRCVLPHEIGDILFQSHDGMEGGYIASELTMRNVLQARLWWPTLFKDAHKYVLHCDVCQIANRSTYHIPFHLFIPQSPFEKWGLDYVTLIKPTTKGSQAIYILVATYYLSKWFEARVVRNVNAHSTSKFFYN